MSCSSWIDLMTQVQLSVGSERFVPSRKVQERGRPSKKQKPNSHFHALVEISGIFQENGKTINFLKLRFAVVCLTKILKVRRHSIQRVKESNLFQFFIRLASHHIFIYV